MTATVTEMTRRHVGAIVIAAVALGGATLVNAAPTGLARPASVHREAGRIRRPDPAGAHLATSAGPAVDAAAQALFSAVNAERSRVGLPALAWSAGATAAAQGHAADIASRDRLTHTGSDGSNAGTRLQRAGVAPTAWAENIAAGYRDAAEVAAAWMASPGHRANMVGNYRYAGIGVAASASGTPYWVLVLTG